jgi:hypothetical protein
VSGLEAGLLQMLVLKEDREQVKACVISRGHLNHGLRILMPDHFEINAENQGLTYPWKAWNSVISAICKALGF